MLTNLTITVWFLFMAIPAQVRPTPWGSSTKLIKTVWELRPMRSGTFSKITALSKKPVFLFVKFTKTKFTIFWILRKTRNSTSDKIK